MRTAERVTLNTRAPDRLKVIQAIVELGLKPLHTAHNNAHFCLDLPPTVSPLQTSIKEAP